LIIIVGFLGRFFSCGLFYPSGWKIAANYLKGFGIALGFLVGALALKGQLS